MKAPAIKLFRDVIRDNHLHVFIRCDKANEQFRRLMFQRYKHKCINYEYVYEHRYTFHFKDSENTIDFIHAIRPRNMPY